MKGFLAASLGVQAFLFLILVVLVNMPETQIVLYWGYGCIDLLMLNINCVEAQKSRSDEMDRSCLNHFRFCPYVTDQNIDWGGEGGVQR